MKVKKESKYVVELTPSELQNLIAEMNTVYPLFASEKDVEDIKTLLRLKDELALAINYE